MARKKEKTTGRYIYAIFGILIAAFVIYHTFGSLFDPYVTEEAVETTMQKTISTDCLIVRKENIIKSDNKGYKVCKVQNGGKVSKNSTVVSFYNNADDVEIANKINELENYLQAIEEIDKQNSIKLADLDIISEQTQSNIYSLLKNVSSNNFSENDKILNNLRYYLAQGQLATGREKNYKSVIKKCKNELTGLKAKYEKNIKSVKSDYSGYFVNFTDGYENVIDYDKIRDVTVEDFENMKSVKPQNNEIGKVISENEWYIVTVVNTADIKGISEGDSININTSLSSADSLSVNIKKINKSLDGKKSVLIMSCMKMNSELATMREKNMQLVLKTYRGLKVNSKAVRVKNKKTGVYVKLGSVKRFVNVDIIYHSKEYVIVKTENGNNQLKIYDDVIVKGKNLDG